MIEMDSGGDLVSGVGRTGLEVWTVWEPGDNWPSLTSTLPPSLLSPVHTVLSPPAWIMSGISTLTSDPPSYTTSKPQCIGLQYRRDQLEALRLYSSITYLLIIEFTTITTSFFELIMRKENICKIGEICLLQTVLKESISVVINRATVDSNTQWLYQWL